MKQNRAQINLDQRKNALTVVIVVLGFLIKEFSSGKKYFL